MSRSRSIFLVSLAANFLLIGVIAAGWLSTTGGVAASALPTPVKPKLPAEPPANWTTVQADDLAEQCRRLEAEGFSRAAIRAVVTGLVKTRFAERRKALEDAKAKQPFWKNTAYDPALLAESRALAKDEQDAVRAVLGPDLDGSIATSLRRQLPGVPADRIDQLVAICERYSDQRQAVVELQRGIITPDDRERLNQLEHDMHAEFARILSPQELEDYDLRTSRVADTLRYNLGNFSLTEGEFRAVYRLKEDLAERFPETGPATPDGTQRLREAEKLTENQIATALGPERYAEYKKATDYSYRQTSILLSRLGLPGEAADALYVAKTEFEQRRDAVYKLNLSRPETVRQATALQEEATARIRTILSGDANAMAAYLEYGGSWWRYLGPSSPLAPKK